MPENRPTVKQSTLLAAWGYYPNPNQADNSNRGNGEIIIGAGGQKHRKPIPADTEDYLDDNIDFGDFPDDFGEDFGINNEALLQPQNEVRQHFRALAQTTNAHTHQARQETGQAQTWSPAGFQKSSNSAAGRQNVQATNAFQQLRQPDAQNLQNKNSTRGSKKESAKSSRKSKTNVANEVNVVALPQKNTIQQRGNQRSIANHAVFEDDPELPQFDYSTEGEWIYPTNYPKREYQFNIVEASLLKNTLVSLPTGLGKTFIAAVVMYNFYRWFPTGTVVFMAPTRPLVAQQIEACYSIMGISQADTAEMTGQQHPELREKLWQTRRVIFLTPQVLVNDLVRGTCQAKRIVCLVVDEAHKATGNHAYVQVVRELMKHTRHFRVLALSATPGDQLESVCQLVSSLCITHLELRTDASIDIQPYVHERQVDVVVVALGQELGDIKARFGKVLGTYIKRLCNAGAYYEGNVDKASKWSLLQARDRFRENPNRSYNAGMVEMDFSLAISLVHAYNLLTQHGLVAFYKYLQGVMEGDKGFQRARNDLSKNADFLSMMADLEAKFDVGASQKKNLIGHPKVAKLEEVIISHFQEHGAKTRVMVFSHYRDSVTEIVERLARNPLIKVMPFIGQSSLKTKGLKQKEQLKVLQDFRNGVYNTLCATCVGEEGLDIGDVDLIVCFDAQQSSTRLVQRMGRCGRKRKGRIVMLLTEGKEHNNYKKSLRTKNTMHKTIHNERQHLPFYTENADMVPPTMELKVVMRHMTSAQPFDRSVSTGKNTRVKRGPKGLLTEDEMRSYQSLYALEPGEEAPRLSLTKWTCLQSVPSPVYRVGHSSRSKILMSTLEFMEEMGPDQEASAEYYDREMARLLPLVPSAPGDAQEVEGGTDNVRPKKPQAKRKGRAKKQVSLYDLDTMANSEEELEAELPSLDFLFNKADKQKSRTKARPAKQPVPIRRITKTAAAIESDSGSDRETSNHMRDRADYAPPAPSDSISTYAPHVQTEKQSPGVQADDSPLSPNVAYGLVHPVRTAILPLADQSKEPINSCVETTTITSMEVEGFENDDGEEDGAGWDGGLGLDDADGFLWEEGMDGDVWGAGADETWLPQKDETPELARDLRDAQRSTNYGGPLDTAGSVDGGAKAKKYASNSQSRSHQPKVPAVPERPPQPPMCTQWPWVPRVPEPVRAIFCCDDRPILPPPADMDEILLDCSPTALALEFEAAEARQPESAANEEPTDDLHGLLDGLDDSDLLEDITIASRRQSSVSIHVVSSQTPQLSRKEHSSKQQFGRSNRDSHHLGSAAPLHTPAQQEAQSAAGRLVSNTSAEDQSRSTKTQGSQSNSPVYGGGGLSEKDLFPPQERSDHDPTAYNQSEQHLETTNAMNGKDATIHANSHGSVDPLQKSVGKGRVGEEKEGHEEKPQPNIFFMKDDGMADFDLGDDDDFLLAVADESNPLNDNHANTNTCDNAPFASMNIGQPTANDTQRNSSPAPTKDAGDGQCGGNECDNIPVFSLLSDDEDDETLAVAGVDFGPPECRPFQRKKHEGSNKTENAPTIVGCEGDCGSGNELATSKSSHKDDGGGREDGNCARSIPDATCVKGGESQRETASGREVWKMPHPVQPTPEQMEVRRRRLSSNENATLESRAQLSSQSAAVLGSQRNRDFTGATPKPGKLSLAKTPASAAKTTPTAQPPRSSQPIHPFTSPSPDITRRRSARPFQFSPDTPSQCQSPSSKSQRTRDELPPVSTPATYARGIGVEKSQKRRLVSAESASPSSVIVRRAGRKNAVLFSPSPPSTENRQSRDVVSASIRKPNWPPVTTISSSPESSSPSPIARRIGKNKPVAKKSNRLESDSEEEEDEKERVEVREEIEESESSSEEEESEDVSDGDSDDFESGDVGVAQKGKKEREKRKRHQREEERRRVEMLRRKRRRLLVEDEAEESDGEGESEEDEEAELNGSFIAWEDEEGQEVAETPRRNLTGSPASPFLRAGIPETPDMPFLKPRRHRVVCDTPQRYRDPDEEDEEDEYEVECTEDELEENEDEEENNEEDVTEDEEDEVGLLGDNNNDWLYERHKRKKAEELSETLALCRNLKRQRQEHSITETEQKRLHRQRMREQLGFSPSPPKPNRVVTKKRANQENHDDEFFSPVKVRKVVPENRPKAPLAQLSDGANNQRQQEDARKARLQRQKELQAEFRKQTAEEPPPAQEPTEALAVVAKGGVTEGENLGVRADNVQSLLVLVDSGEVSSSQINSTLRTLYRMQTAPRSLSVCDYVLSTRLGVIHTYPSELAGSQRDKLFRRISYCQTVFEKVLLIVEERALKKGSTTVSASVKAQQEAAMATLVNLRVPLLPSPNQDHSARLLHRVAVQEAAAGYSIPSELASMRDSNEALKFLCTLPLCGFFTAAMFLHNKKDLCPRQLLLSSAEQIRQFNPSLSVAHAQLLHKFFNRKHTDLPPVQAPSRR